MKSGPAREKKKGHWENQRQDRGAFRTGSCLCGVKKKRLPPSVGGSQFDRRMVGQGGGCIVVQGGEKLDPFGMGGEDRPLAANHFRKLDEKS